MQEAFNLIAFDRIKASDTHDILVTNITMTIYDSLIIFGLIFLLAKVSQGLTLVTE